MITFVTGGARSGKSNFAEKRANKYNHKLYVATSLAFDKEMQYRIKTHQVQRGKNWDTLEEYQNLSHTLHVKSKNKEVILVDCLTNMVSNLMIMDRNINWDTINDEAVALIEEEIKQEIIELLEFGKFFDGEMIIVTNEIGMGLVPEYHLGRRFRDISGRMNQYVASHSNEAYLIVSGLEIKLK